MVNNRVHHNIEDGGRQWVALGNASLLAEGFSVVPSHPYHHLKPLPVPAEEAEGPDTHVIYLKDVQAPGFSQGVLILVKV